MLLPSSIQLRKELVRSTMTPMLQVLAIIAAALPSSGDACTTANNGRRQTSDPQQTRSGRQHHRWNTPILENVGANAGIAVRYFGKLTSETIGSSDSENENIKDE
ncbi:hypothetical protein Tco_0064251 [Tanacetum coccineum]